MSSTGNYIIIFKKATPDSVIDQEISRLELQGAVIGHRYNMDNMKGFAVQKVQDAHLAQFQSSEHLDFIEADGEISTYGASVVKA